MHATDILAYTFDASVHCTECTVKQYGTEPGHSWASEAAEDSEGNPVHPVFASETEGFSSRESCDDCQQVICMSCGSIGEPFDAPCNNCGSMGSKFWEVVVTCAGAVDYQVPYATLELAQEAATGQQEEYTKEVDCYYCAIPEASHGEDSHDYRPITIECQIVVMYDMGDNLEGSQWAGEEPITVWQYPEPTQEINGQTSLTE